ncbi:GNAT superfamily N-acetyltransferase [Haloferula luteola]|uniref:GNAT superfamily N-acetyltransferase n=1 Tax=Haloferula luteola TaxID=595692 RepID=A0A840V5E1_9BACT|nr:GNAT family N-acetyltransferase [Haloferula luteola]MBB5352246.1 GNAT superfamily N-acetyltransferase [Haloferula luteola]
MKIEPMETRGTTADEIWAVEGGRARVGLWYEQAPEGMGGRVGCLGGFEARDEAAAGWVLEKGCARLREMGCAMAVGPMDGNTWRRHRWVTDRRERPAFFMEPCNPPEWPVWWAKAGFDVLSRYSSSRIQLGEMRPNLKALERRLTAEGVQLRPLAMARFEEELGGIYQVCISSFSKNFLYTPLDRESFVGMYAPLREVIQSEFVWVAGNGDELCGFVFGVPDVAAQQRGEEADFIVKTLAVLPDKRWAGLGSLLVDRVQQSAMDAGFRHGIHALQRETNPSLRITDRFGGQRMRGYVLMSKVL